jgi:uncharacterized membrane protein YozB (DUF420 family)
MNPFLEPPGFLGTGASLLADITLLAYILLIVPAILAGFFLARAGKHRPAHKWVMIIITLVNWVLIIFLMFAAYVTDVGPNLGSQFANPRYLFPAVHGLLGALAQLLATYIVVRMIWEDAQVSRAKKRGETDLRKYWFKGAKGIMRFTLLLWLITASLGIISYLVRYNVVTLASNVPAPVATQEVAPPASTEAIPLPAVTEEAVMPPTATEETTASPAETEEAD